MQPSEQQGLEMRSYGAEPPAVSRLAALLGFSSNHAAVRDLLLTLGLMIMSMFCSTIYCLGPALTPLMEKDMSIDPGETPQCPTVHWCPHDTTRHDTTLR